MWLTTIVHILLPETDNCPSWISRIERMTVEYISWSNLHERMLLTRRGSTRNLLITSRTILAKSLLFMHLLLKILSGMANSVDPDQPAPSEAVWSGSALFAYVILSDTFVFKILGYLHVPSGAFWSGSALFASILSDILVFKILGNLP